MEKRENFSRKRAAILNVLQETDVHPTADWVYDQLRTRYKKLSLGTVYRNLKQFCESGKAISVGVVNGQEHFDGRTEPHAHLVCEQCGAVVDVMENFFDEGTLQALSEKTGCRVNQASVMFHGLCKECERREALPEAAES